MFIPQEVLKWEISLKLRVVLKIPGSSHQCVIIAIVKFPICRKFNPCDTVF